MSAEIKPTARNTRQGRWSSREIARQENANRAQVTLDRARGVGANLSEAAALARFANRFAEAFKNARSA
jgi:hypothetical protein